MLNSVAPLSPATAHTGQAACTAVTAIRRRSRCCRTDQRKRCNDHQQVFHINLLLNLNSKSRPKEQASRPLWLSERARRRDRRSFRTKEFLNNADRETLLGRKRWNELLCTFQHGHESQRASSTALLFSRRLRRVFAAMIAVLRRAHPRATVSGVSLRKCRLHRHRRNRDCQQQRSRSECAKPSPHEMDLKAHGLRGQIPRIVRRRR